MLSPELTRVDVDSSNIKALGYAPDTLLILFNSGITYSYDGVPADVFEAMAKAESVGKFFHQAVRGKYHYTKVDGAPLG